MTALVDPPSAIINRIAFSNALGVRTSLGRMPCSTVDTICSTVCAGIPMTRRSAPGTAIATTAPCMSMTAAPSNPWSKRASNSSRCAISPPRRERQAGPASRTLPQIAAGPCGSRPTIAIASPTRRIAAGASEGSGPAWGTRNTATSVARSAASTSALAAPLSRCTSRCSASATASAAVTSRSPRQRMPETTRRRPSVTAPTLGNTLANKLARSLLHCLNIGYVAISSRFSAVLLIHTVSQEPLPGHHPNG